MRISGDVAGSASPTDSPAAVPLTQGSSWKIYGDVGLSPSMKAWLSLSVVGHRPPAGKGETAVVQFRPIGRVSL